MSQIPDVKEDETNTPNDEDEEKDDGMLIEQLGRDYLSRNNALRRHTIGTNVNDSLSSDISESKKQFFLIFRVKTAQYIICDHERF